MLPYNCLIEGEQIQYVLGSMQAQHAQSSTLQRCTWHLIHEFNCFLAYIYLCLRVTYPMLYMMQSTTQLLPSLVKCNRVAYGQCKVTTKCSIWIHTSCGLQIHCPHEACGLYCSHASQLHCPHDACGHCIVNMKHVSKHVQIHASCGLSIYAILKVYTSAENMRISSNWEYYNQHICIG